MAIFYCNPNYELSNTVNMEYKGKRKRTKPKGRRNKSSGKSIRSLLGKFDFLSRALDTSISMEIIKSSFRALNDSAPGVDRITLSYFKLLGEEILFNYDC